MSSLTSESPDSEDRPWVGTKETLQSLRSWEPSVVEVQTRVQRVEKGSVRSVLKGLSRRLRVVIKYFIYWVENRPTPLSDHVCDLHFKVVVDVDLVELLYSSYHPGWTSGTNGFLFCR